MHKSATDAEIKAAVDALAYDNELLVGYFFESVLRMVEGRV